jgi:hypothetical protein
LLSLQRRDFRCSDRPMQWHATEKKGRGLWFGFMNSDVNFVVTWAIPCFQKLPDPQRFYIMICDALVDYTLMWFSLQLGRFLTSRVVFYDRGDKKKDWDYLCALVTFIVVFAAYRTLVTNGYKKWPSRRQKKLGLILVALYQEMESRAIPYFPNSVGYRNAISATKRRAWEGLGFMNSDVNLL